MTRLAELKADIAAGKEVNFANVSTLICFGWLLKAEELAEVKKLGHKVLATRLVTTRAAESKSHKTCESAPQDMVARFFAC